PAECHHGDCVGADAQFHALAQEAGALLVIHPPADDSQRAVCRGSRLWPAKDHLARDRQIVDETEVLLATPPGFKEEPSGRRPARPQGGAPPPPRRPAVSGSTTRPGPGPSGSRPAPFLTCPAAHVLASNHVARASPMPATSRRGGPRAITWVSTSTRSRGC